MLKTITKRTLEEANIALLEFLKDNEYTWNWTYADGKDFVMGYETVTIYMAKGRKK